MSTKTWKPDKPWKVTYFDARGRAESIRLILVEVGVPFQDVRLTRDEWNAMKASAPTHTLPTLEVDDGTVLGQSSAILRFLGNRFDMYSNDLMEQYRTDLVMNIIDDLVDKELIPALFEKDPVKMAEKKKNVEAESLPGYMELLTKQLREGGNEFFVGRKLTIADIKVFTVLENIAKHFPETLPKWDELRSFKERMSSRDRIAGWIKTRPDTRI